MHAHRRKVLARQAQDAQLAAQGSAGVEDGRQVAAAGGRGGDSHGGGGAAGAPEVEAATPNAALAASDELAGGGDGDDDENDEGGAAKGKRKAAAPPSAAVEAAVPPSASASNGSAGGVSGGGNSDAVVAFLPGRAAELEAAVARFQFLLVKVWSLVLIYAGVCHSEGEREKDRRLMASTSVFPPLKRRATPIPRHFFSSV